MFMKMARQFWLMAIVLAITPSAYAELGGESSAGTQDTSQQVAELIEQLGAPRYVVRQSAQQQLRGLGLAAFDQLLASSTHPDPEIAAASRRLLKTLTIRWTRPADPPSVRRLFEQYSTFNEQQRREAVGRLQRSGDTGIAALCRIARFDASERVSREAAIALLDRSDYEFPTDYLDAIEKAEQALTAEFGASRRPAGQWLRLLLRQAKEPAEVLTSWRRALAAEERLVDQRRPETDERLLAVLRENWLRVQLAAGQNDALLDTVDQLVDANPQQAEAILTQSLEWMVAAGADEGVDDLLDARRDLLTTKRGLYLAGMIRHKQGRHDAAEKLAEQAFATPPNSADDRVVDNRKLIDGRTVVGQHLESHGHAEWARREYREAAKQTPPLSVNAVYSHGLLANSLFDEELYAEAADVFAAVIDAVSESPATRARYASLTGDYEFIPTFDALQARRDFFLAKAASQTGDLAVQIERLRAALAKDNSDADFLIALHRVAHESGDLPLQKEVSELIRDLAATLQEQIDATPENPVPYNHWAWLISNTEGDFAKAVRYSRRSLALRPGDAGYLDTLGRCYYAVGDLKQAIQHQREAVDKEPHMQVLRRQLEFFEQELARSQKAEEDEAS